jgi:hypothetical protein
MKQRVENQTPAPFALRLLAAVKAFMTPMQEADKGISADVERVCCQLATDPVGGVESALALAFAAEPPKRKAKR